MPRSRQLLAALALLALAACATSPAAPPVAQVPAPKQQADSEYIPVGGSPVRGPRDALVTLVVFCDFECPYCERAMPTLGELRKRYGDDLRIVFKHQPLKSNHAYAELAAEASLAAHAQGRFWEMHDLLFATREELAPEVLERHAQSLGLDMVRFREELTRHVHLPRIRADQKLAEQLGADGTPSFVINGTAFSGAQPLEAFVKAIEPVLARARSLPERTQVYARMTAEPLPPVAGSVRRTRMLPEPAARVEGPVKVRPQPRAPTRGNPDAPVVLEYFAGFECPFSARHAETMRRVAETYGDKVRFIWRDFPMPFHSHGRPAAEAAREALAQKGNAGFWRMHDALFATPGALQREDLERHAQQQGLDVVRFRRVLDLELHGDDLWKDVEAGAAAGVEGTPSTFINGRLLVGAQPFETFQELIDAELKRR